MTEKEGNQSVTNCHALKMRAKDGLMLDNDKKHKERITP